MISKFLREQKRYTLKDLRNRLECFDEHKLIEIIKKLKEYGVLKAVKASDEQKDMSELMDEDIEVADIDVGERGYYYVFTYVGIIVVNGIVLKCYPKYLLSNDKPKEELCQILKVLQKYNSKEQIIRMFTESSEHSSFNQLAVMLFLLRDYYESGAYSNTQDIIENNGLGEILWDKTINETFALIYNNRPYYTDLQTKKRVVDDYDYFKRLHECIITLVSKELKDADLLELFEIAGLDLSDEQLDDFGDDDYILERLEKELSTQFNTRKQLILKTIYTYIHENGTLYDEDCFSSFGTNKFNLVWEKICAEIMDNQLDVEMKNLKLPCSLNTKYDENEKLIDLIEKPYWSFTEKTATKTLIPDLISIQGNQFIIFDAKYYNAMLEKNNVPKGQPGIESVTKQYLYQLAYKEFIEDHGFTKVENCFLIPTEKKEIIDKGEVSMPMLSSLGLKDIKVRFIPADIVYNNYLSAMKTDISLLKL